jgi:hypothetical protein
MCAEFWWNWGVQFAVAVGTIGAVFVALFGDWLRAKFTRLRVQVVNRLGVPTPTVRQTRLGDQVAHVGAGPQARYYHVRVSNLRPRFLAHQVNVFLLPVEEPGPNGDLQVTWTGEIPMIWQHQDYFPGARTIGNPANVDVFRVTQEKELTLFPLIPALNLNAVYRSACNLTLTLQARSDEGESPVMRVRIAWDGEWHDGNEEMGRHLVFEEL